MVIGDTSTGRVTVVIEIASLTHRHGHIGARAAHGGLWFLRHPHNTSFRRCPIRLSASMFGGGVPMGLTFRKLRDRLIRHER